MTEETIFAGALQKKTPEERSAYLDEACGDDAALRERVEQLLRSHEQAGSFLQDPAIKQEGTIDFPGDPALTNLSAASVGPGTCIGSYKLLQQIGQGGMGVVWMAEQEKPLRRKVAFKIIKPGLDSREVIARFQAERQALALMDHQNIAKVLDAGTTGTGHPYFVMELVKGVKITKFCDDNHFTLQERLNLFIPVCQAVQHAHQKGIIHRDIKPSNVLVALYDGKPVPKVIDFGVAKAIDQRLTERTLFTQFGQIVGTFEYMSPEQAEMSALDIDTRSDIYSLGVLLYELLTGSPPLDRKQLRGAGLEEMLRLIREADPPRPSTRLSDSGKALGTLSAQRKTELQRLTRLVRGELDGIVMKSLDKDRTRRYETANAFARDLERYLSGEPVEACLPSAFYKFRKYVRKHRTAVLILIAFMAVLTLGIVISTWQAFRAAAAEMQARYGEQRALKAEGLAKERLVLVKKERDAAEKARQRAEFVKDYLLRAFRSPRPELDGRQIKVVNILDQAAAELEKKFHDDPVLRADLLEALGRTYDRLGLPHQALPLLKEADKLNAMHRPGTLGALVTQSHLAIASGNTGDIKAAYDLLQDVYRQCCAHKELGPDAAVTLRVATSLGLARMELGDHANAIDLLKDTIERLNQQGQSALHAQEHLALTYRQARRYDEALKIYKQTVEELRKQRTPEDALLLYWEKQHLSTRIMAGQISSKNAVAQLEKIVKQFRQVFGEDSRATLNAQATLAKCYANIKEHKKALKIYDDVLQQMPGDDDDTIKLLVQYDYGNLKIKAGKHDEGLRILEEVVEKLTIGDHLRWDRARRCARDLAGRYYRQRDHQKAEALTTKVANAVRRLFPADSSPVRKWTFLQGVRYRHAGKYKLAEKYLSQLAKLQQRLLDEGKIHPATRKGELGNLGFILAHLTMTRLKLAKYAEAEAAARHCLAIREKVQPESWLRYETMSVLGEALLGQKKYAEAEPMLLQGYQGMKECKAKIPASLRLRLTEALERIVRLYDAWGKQEKAVRWRNKLNSMQKKGS